MATAIILPKQGNTVESCLLLEWKKKKGDKVKKGDIICEVETDKAVFEIEASENGILLETFFNEGDEIPVLTNIAVVGKEGESFDDLKPGIDDNPVSEIEKDELSEENKKSEKKETVAVKKDTFESVTTEENNNKPVGISPRAKRLAIQKGVNTDSLTGTGPMNRIIERDIISIINSGQPLTPAAKDLMKKENVAIKEGTGIGGRITSDDIKKYSKTKLTKDIVKIEEVKGIRKIISERMLESLRNSAQLTLNSSADATALLSLRETFKNSKLSSEFNKVNINDLIMFAVIKVLPKHPIVNSLLKDHKIHYYENIHLGFAVDTERGLMVPTIKNSQNLSLLELSGEVKRLVNACRENKIQLEELSGATFTITNLGNMGIDDFTPVINLPQNAILGISRINLKPVQINNKIEFVPHIGLSLTINHQVIDGAEGARFLQDLSLAIKEISLLIAI